MLGKPPCVSSKADEESSLTPRNFIGYNLLRAGGPVNGKFNEQRHVVTDEFRDSSWKEVDFNGKYLKMRVSHPC